MGWFGPVGDCGCVQDCDEPCADVACLDSGDGASSTDATRLAITMSGFNSVDTYRMLSVVNLGGGTQFMAEFTGLDFLNGTYVVNKTASPDCQFVASGTTVISLDVDIYEIDGLDTDGCPTPITFFDSYTATRLAWTISYNDSLSIITATWRVQYLNVTYIGLFEIFSEITFTKCAGGSFSILRTNFYEKSPGVPCAGSSSSLGSTSTYAFLP